MPGRLLLFGLLLSLLEAGAVRWKGDYEAAHKEALLRGLPLLVLVSVESCTECRGLVLRIAQEKKLSEWVSQRCVAVIVHADSKGDYPIELYFTTRFPTLFIVRSDLETPLAPPCSGEHACIEAMKHWSKELP